MSGIIGKHSERPVLIHNLADDDHNNENCLLRRKCLRQLTNAGRNAVALIQNTSFYGNIHATFEPLVSYFSRGCFLLFDFLMV